MSAAIYAYIHTKIAFSLLSTLCIITHKSSPHFVCIWRYCVEISLKLEEGCQPWCESCCKAAWQWRAPVCVVVDFFLFIVRSVYVLCVCGFFPISNIYFHSFNIIELRYLVHIRVMKTQVNSSHFNGEMLLNDDTQWICSMSLCRTIDILAFVTYLARMRTIMAISLSIFFPKASLCRMNSRNCSTLYQPFAHMNAFLHKLYRWLKKKKLNSPKSAF